MLATSYLIPLLALTGANAAVLLSTRAPSNAKKASVQLFEWNWASVGAECPTLASLGYGWVQVSPAQEHITGDQWWTDYQAVSYKLQSKRGNRDQFKAMVDACHAVGVNVIVDILFNHMAGIDSGTGVAGSSFTHYNYPGIYDSNDFHYCGTTNNAINDYGNEWEVENCQLSNLADLKTETEKVRADLAAHANDLLSLGVDGFRLDAAKHLPPADIANIISRFSRAVYITQEVEDTSGSFSSQHAAQGDVNEFRFAYAMKDAFQSSGIASLSNIASRGWLSSGSANVFVANHDTERGGQTLSQNIAGSSYILAHVFMLSFGYGSPTVLSSYSFSSVDAGGPNGGYGTCSGSTWSCQHRWPAIANMVTFFNLSVDQYLHDVVTPTSNRIAYGRNNVGHVAINNEGSAWSDTFQTWMADGRYCDVISGAKSGSSCTAATITISGGKFTTSVPAQWAIAIHSGSKL